MPNEVKLLPCPCPFCGCSMEPPDEISDRCSHPSGPPRCFLTGLSFDADDIVHWNHRPTTVVTDEVVERVARALWELEFGTEGKWPINVENPDDWYAQARAALAAMPTVVTGE